MDSSIKIFEDLIYSNKIDILNYDNLACPTYELVLTYATHHLTDSYHIDKMWTLKYRDGSEDRYQISQFEDSIIRRIIDGKTGYKHEISIELGISLIRRLISNSNTIDNWKINAITRLYRFCDRDGIHVLLLYANGKVSIISESPCTKYVPVDEILLTLLPKDIIKALDIVSQDVEG